MVKPHERSRRMTAPTVKRFTARLRKATRCRTRRSWPMAVCCQDLHPRTISRGDTGANPTSPMCAVKSPRYKTPLAVADSRESDRQARARRGLLLHREGRRRRQGLLLRRGRGRGLIRRTRWFFLLGASISALLLTLGLCDCLCVGNAHD